jgi:hypothetical protein
VLLDDAGAMTLLREIQTAALDSSVDLADLLRKCKVLAARLKHAEFSAWVDQELNGYREKAKLPAYRKIKVDSLGYFSGPFGSTAKNAPIPPSNIDEKLRHLVTEQGFSESVSALAQLAKGDPKLLQGTWPADLIKYVQHNCPIYPDMVLMSAWRVIPGAAVAAVLSTVRTRILDFVLAIEEKEPLAGDVPPGEPAKLAPQAVTNIFNTTINGGTVGAVGNVQAESLIVSNAIPAKDRKRVAKLVGELRSAVDSAPPADRDDAEQALAKVEQQLAAPEPQLPKLKSYLDLYATLVTVAAPTVDALKTLLTHVLNSL